MLATITRDFTPKCQSTAVDTAFNTLVAIPLACTDANGDRFTVEKVGLPAAGQLGEIVNGGSVFYSPFANFIGSDSFTIRAKSSGPRGRRPAGDGQRDRRGAGRGTPDRESERASTVTATASSPARTATTPTPRSGPGRRRSRATRTDENCDGIAEPFPTLASGVVSKWDVKGSRLTLTTLQVTQQFPSGWKARIICRGKPKCTFTSKSLKAGKVRRGAATIISSLTKRQRVFRAGQTVEIWVSAPNFNTKVARLVLKRNRIPVTEPFCVLPGSSLVQKTCT